MFRIKAFWFGVRYDALPECFGSPSLFRETGSSISIGRHVKLISSSIRCTTSTLYGPVRLRTLTPSASITLGDGVGLNGTSITVRSTSVTIGEGTMIGPNVTIIDASFHALWPAETRSTNMDSENDAAVIIGKNVWIGMQAIILKGVNIGDNSVIAAGSIVTSDIPANTLAAGAPAKPIRDLSASSN